MVRELDGHVPAPLLCVDADGTVLAAALPERPPRGASLEGRRLCDLLDAKSSANGLLGDLTRTGHSVVTLAEWLGSSRGARGYAVLVKRPSADEPALPQPELMPGIIDAVPDPMFALDSELRVNSVNAACRELLGPASHELLNRPFESVFEEPERGREFAELLRRGARPRQRARLRSRAAREVELTPRPLFGRSYQPIGWVVWVRDPSSQARAEGPVEELEHCLRTVAHDLRGPLCSMRGFAWLLEREFGALLGSVGQSYLGRLRLGIDRAHGLLEDLLELSRLRQTLGPRSFVSPLEVLRQLAAELKPELEKRGVRLVLPSDPPCVYADPIRFSQVALNLLSNAIQHMGDVEDPEIRVELRADPAGNVLVVTDNGRGIRPEDQERIFELFTSIHPDPASENSGLGLAIVQRIMDAHGGRVEIESAEGSGASFRALFPNPG